LWIFDQPFLQQVDLDLFGTATRLMDSPGGGAWLRAAGAAVSLQGTLLGTPLPLGLGLQAAYRFDHGRGWLLQVVGTAT
ncbi:MAG TPA: hypothetical protein VFH51_13725, partial [Myxococcota bacterium]|nr:hypothetical protein [Myxococcota bacterium]